jgi:hypothetical protein
MMGAGWLFAVVQDKQPVGVNGVSRDPKCHAVVVCCYLPLLCCR